MDNGLGNTILIVDDDRGILESFDAMLGDDYPLTMIDNGVKALAFLNEKQPRLMFLDLKMPGLNGIEVLKWIRDREVDVKVVVVTALPQDHYESLAMEYGVYRYLRKPLDLDEIEGITRTVLH